MANGMFYEIVNGKRVARRRPSFPLMGITEWARSELKRKHSRYATADFYDPIQNVDAATDYLKFLLNEKHEARRVFRTYGSGPQYLSEIREAEKVLQSNPADPMAALKSVLGDK